MKLMIFLNPLFFLLSFSFLHFHAILHSFSILLLPDTVSAAALPIKWIFTWDIMTKCNARKWMCFRWMIGISQTHLWCGNMVAYLSMCNINIQVMLILWISLLTQNVYLRNVEEKQKATNIFMRIEFLALYGF